LLTFAAKSFINTDEVIVEGGYRSNASGILYDYTPAKFEQALVSGKPTLLDFSADWCPPCRITAPILDKLREEYGGEVNILTANVDNEGDLVLKYREEWFPTFIFFDRNGDEVRRVRGLIFEDDFRLAIDELLNDNIGTLKIPVILPEEVLKRMNQGERLNLIDVRTPNEYKTGHIPGALSIPLSTISENDHSGLGLDKDDEIIVYCQGGIRSRRAARILILMGYRNVKDMGGILDWTKVGGQVVTK
jgi:rhodanese-related sulfurtransferase